MTRPTLAIAVVLLLAASAGANPTDRQLFDEIRRLDAEEFARFNAHDLGGTMSFFAEELEFYHDKDGLLSRAQVNEGFTRLFAQNNGMRRELVPGTLEVYPIPGYGALEKGRHRFCHVENGRDDCGVFEFVQIWRKSGERWKVTRAFSYGH